MLQKESVNVRIDKKIKEVIISDSNGIVISFTFEEAVKLANFLLVNLPNKRSKIKTNPDKLKKGDILVG
jgi:hypothetical protein